MKILGLQYGKKYTEASELKTILAMPRPQYFS